MSGQPAGPSPAIHSTPAALVGAFQRNTRGSRRAGGPPDVTWGKVTAVDTSTTPSTCTVKIRGRSVIAGIAHLDQYGPTVGDRVVLFEWSTAAGEDRLVVGSASGSSGGGGGGGGTTGALLIVNNLSDLDDAATARDNLGLGSAATVDTGTGSGDVPVLNSDGRLDMARLASGTPDGTKFVRDDGTLAVPSGGGGGSLTSQSKMLTSIVHFGSSSPTVLSDSFAVGTWHVTVILSPMSNTGAPRQVIATASVSAGTATIVGVSTALVELTNVDAPMPLVLSFFLTVTATATVKITGYTSATDVTVGDNANTTGYTAVKIA